MTKGQKKAVKKQEVVVQPDKYYWPLSEKQNFWVFAGVITILTVILYSRYLFGPDLFIFTDVASDTMTMFYPNLVHAARYFQEVGFPGWSFYLGLGGNTYPGFLNSPLNLIFLPMDPVAIAYVIPWLQVAVMVGTGLVFFRFMREALFSLPVCMIGSVIYTFGGYLVIGSTWYAHSHAIFWMTVALLGFELLIRKKQWWIFPIPFIVLLGTRGYFLVLFMAIYSLVRIIDIYGSSWREWIGGYKRIIICGVFAALVALPFVGGKWHRISNSPRVAGDVSYNQFLTERSTFHVATKEHFLTALFRTYSNDAIGSANLFKGWKNYLEAPAFYIGLLTLFLVFQFFALANKKRRLLYGLFLAFWIFLIVFPWFRFAFYGFAGNYYKGALSLFIPFSFLFVGMLGFQEIIKGKRLNLPVLIISFLILIVLLWFPYVEPEINIDRAVLIKVSIFLSGYLIILGALWAGILKKYILSLLSIVVLTEALIFSWPALNERIAIPKLAIETKRFHFDYSMDAIDYIKYTDNEDFYRVEKVFGSAKSGYNDGMVQGYFSTKMYQSFNPNNYVRFLHEIEMIDGRKEANTRWLQGVVFNSLLHPLFSIKYILSNETTLDKVDNSIYTKIHQAGNVAVHRNNFYIPLGIPFSEYIEYNDFKTLDRNSKSLALYKGIILDRNTEINKEGLTKVELGNNPGGLIMSARLREMAGKAMKTEFFNHKKIKGSIQVDKPSILFFSIPFDTGWKAKVDGVPQELHRVHLGFTGLRLDQGNHQVELKYVPPLSDWGWIGIGLAILLVFLIYHYKSKFWA